MKVLSYNIRGVGSTVKRKEIQSLIQKYNFDFCCVQETKDEDLSVETCREIWGFGNFGWAKRDSIGRSGGILSIWNSEKFKVTSSWDMPGAVVVVGFWGIDRIKCCVINVYAPSGLADKLDLWDIIQLVIQQYDEDCVCLAGDFNSIRTPGERSGRGSSIPSSDIAAFDGFIRDSNMLDLPMIGRKFSRYQPDGKCKSRIDRILVNNNWITVWPSSSLKGLPRTISDHCPLALETKTINWGPKPFRFVNAWCSYPNFLEFVEKVWSGYDIEGWGGFKVKEKLKLLKEDLKKWNTEVFGSLDHKIDKLKLNIQELDLYDEVFGLEEEEVIKRKEATTDLFRSLKQRNSLLAQKAKIRWLKEGDVNSKFFHRAINFRRKGNGIAVMLLDGEWIEDVKGVKEGIFSFFKNHFSRTRRTRPSMAADLFANKLSPEDNEFLLAPFSEDEVKLAIENCESSKSPDPDGFNFKFIKVCWAVIKKDFLQMLSEFHEHGKLVRGLNPSFIALIPKKKMLRVYRIIGQSP